MENVGSSYILVQSNPIVSDPRELHTILSFSLRSLFGECEPYGSLVSVLETHGSKAILQCPDEHVDHVRAALTMCFPPIYLQPALYQFDCLQIEAKRSLLKI
jgi:RNase P/RNase MRP subunit POP5